MPYKNHDEGLRHARINYRRRRAEKGLKPQRRATERKNGKKLCPHCKKWLDESMFNKNKLRPDGLKVNCRVCQSKWYENYYQTLTGRYVRYKASAENRNLDFSLSLFDFATIIIQPCHYCGKKDSIYTGVDRIDSSKGYSVDNCAPCCTSCNIAKMAHTEKEFKEDINRRFLHTLLKPFKELKEPLNVIFKN